MANQLTASIWLSCGAGQRHLFVNHARVGPLTAVSMFLALILLYTDRSAVAAEPMPPARPVELLARFDVERGGGPLIIPVGVRLEDPRFGPREVMYRMLVDTGTTCTFFDSRHRATLGQSTGKTIAQTLSGKFEVEKFAAPAMRVGGISMGPAGSVICTDLRPVADGFGEVIDGLLGMDFLCLFALAVDFDAGKLEFYTAADSRFGNPVTLEWDDRGAPGVPHVIADLGGGVEELFRLDTGGVHTISGTLDAESYKRLVRARRLGSVAQNMHVRLFTARSKMDGRLVQAPQFALGAHKHQDLMFATVTHSCLCLGYLSRYVVAFDFPNSTMYLRPGEAFGRADVYNLSGIALERTPGGVAVAETENRMPAATAGIRKGDLILAVDGEKANALSLSALRRILATEGRHVINIRREGVERRFVLDLKIGARNAAIVPAQ